MSEPPFWEGCCFDTISGYPDHYILGCVEHGEHQFCPSPCSETDTTDTAEKLALAMREAYRK
jgi:hypothetical protein